MYYTVFSTGFNKRFDYCGIVWDENKSVPSIKRILLPASRKKVIRRIYHEFGRIKPGKNKEITNLAKKICLYFKGKDVKFTLKYLDAKILTPFQWKVLKILFGIKWGKVRSYGWIAKKAGIAKGGFQAVGQVMANNPFPVICPCHRCIKSDGSIGGFGHPIILKKLMLKLEGVEL